MGARLHTFKIRQLLALAVAAMALDAIARGVARAVPHRQAVLGLSIPAGFPRAAHGLAMFIGLALLALAPRLWRGTRTAASLASCGLLALAALTLHHADYDAGLTAAALAAVLWGSRAAFPLGCCHRPRLAFVSAALGAWALVSGALIAAPHHGHTLRLGSGWTTVIELLALAAATITALAIVSLLRAAPGGQSHTEADDVTARAIIDRHGVDSLAPFVLRPDKALQFAAGGVLSFRVIGETAVVSSDPVAPPGLTATVLERFLGLAHERGWQVVLWGASGRHLAAYHALGLRAVCVGEEAFVDPAAFTLEGRAVRKLRQSVHRVERRGWEIVVRQGRELDTALEAEIDAVERGWRAGRGRLLGFAMGMGRFEAELHPDDLFVMARDPAGGLGAVMRFAAHCGNLSLDTMRRCGETPNGLNEALVCHALIAARGLGVQQVSLNYAGLAHLVRGHSPGSRVGRVLSELLVRALAGRFQMERLVRFNEKFAPEWRPRYLVYESRAALPRSVLRVLQAEGYLPGGQGERAKRPRPLRREPLTGSATPTRAH